MSHPQKELSAKFDASLKKAGVPARDVTLIVGVSGGPDSSALLGLLVDWSKKETGRRIVIAHFNHKLRPEADAEEALVHRLAERFEVDVISDSGDVAAFSHDHKTSLHAAARTLRYQFLGNVARRLSEPPASHPVYLVTAHHRDDQVETILMRLFAGAGVEGLAGIKLVSPCPGAKEISLIRPLLAIPKQHLIDYCQTLDIPFAEDRSNSDESYPRSAIRETILPCIIESFGEGVVGSILRTSELMRLTADFVSAEIERSLKECQIAATRTEIIIDYRAFSSYFYLVRLGLIQRCARILAGDEISRADSCPPYHQNNRIPLERFQAADDGVAAGEKEFQLGGGITVRRHRDKIHIFLAAVQWKSIDFAEGIHLIPGFGSLIVTRIPASQAVIPPPAGTLFIDAEQLKNLGRVIIRPAIAGDTMTPLGAKYPCSVFDLLRDADIPQHRRNAPVLDDDGAIAALIPLRIAHNYRLPAKSRQAYRLTSIFPSADI